MPPRMKYASCQKPVPPESRTSSCHQPWWSSARAQCSSDWKSRQYWRIPAYSGISVNLSFSSLTSVQTAAHIHGPAGFGTPAPILIPLPNGTVTNQDFVVNPTQVQQLKTGLLYFNVHTGNNVNG